MACSFEGDDPHLKSPGYEVQLHGAQHRPASFVSRDYFRAQPVDEDAASAIFRQMETYRGARNRPPGFLRYLYRERARRAGAWSVDSALTLKNLYLENSNLSRCDRGQG